jgi:hypothetical protein
MDESWQLTLYPFKIVFLIMKTKYISIILAVIIIGILVIFYTQKTGMFISPILTPVVGSVCGNGVCESGESSDSCCKDCACQTGYTCIDNKCQNVCGDGICASGETSATCCQDCGCPSEQKCVNNKCQTYCGNGICETNENCESCPQDCKCPSGQRCEFGKCVTFCGNGVCDADESSSNCCKDCGCPAGQQCVNNVCQTYCGNGKCDVGENCGSCPQDCKCPEGTKCINGVCKTYCGNGICDSDESYSTCREDCPSSEFKLSLYNCGSKWDIFRGCYVKCEYSVTNIGNSPAPDTKLYVTSSNYATGVKGEDKTIALGTIYVDGTSTGSFELDSKCDWDVVKVTATAYDTTGTSKSTEVKV